MMMQDFLNVCDKNQNLMIICEDTEAGFTRCIADLVGNFYTKRNIKRIYSKNNGEDIEIVIEVE